LAAEPKKAESPAASTELLAFPGAQGWAAHTPGGRGGQIIRVTTLADKGPGSFLEALKAKGPRVIVFEVGGIIDMKGEEIEIEEPYLTIAGQTAPNPGITLIRAGVNIRAHDVVIQHIRVRTGTAGMAKRTGWEPDAMGTIGAYNVIVDHCSMSWSIDENLSSSGKRFIGATPEEWRQHTSHAITFSNNILAEGLANATHAKGEHSKGSLIHDNVTDILITGNLYAHDAEEWGDHPFQVGKISLVGNVLRAGPSTPNDVALFELGGAGDVELYMKDNIAVDRIGRPLPMLGRYTTSAAKIIEVKTGPAFPEGVKPLAAVDVENSVIANAGARPWERDEVDWRVIADTIEGRGKIIDSEQEVGGYPVQLATFKTFDPNEWDMRYMTPKVAPTYKAIH
jgi:hypothetical protein